MRIFWFLLIAGSLLVASVSGLQLALFKSSLDTHFREGTRTQGELLGNLLAEPISQQLLQGRLLEIRETLRDITAKEDWVAYLFVTGFDGKLAAHSFDKGFPKALLPRLAAENGPQVLTFDTASAPVSDLAVPLIPGLPAVLHVGIDEQPLRQLTQNLLRNVFLLSLGVLIVSVLLWLMLSRRIAEPLQRFARRLEAYRHGEDPDLATERSSPFLEISRLDETLKQTVEQRQQLESMLRDREAHLRLLVENTPVGLALTDMEGNLVEVNQAFADIIGYDIDEVLQMSYWQITPRGYAAQEQRQLELLDSTGRYGPYEKEYIHRDGHRVPVRLSGQIIQRDGQRYIWSSVEDVSDRHQAARLAVMFEYLLNHAEEEIFLIDPTTLLIQQASRGACRRLGYGREELKRMTPMDFNPELDPDYARKQIEAVEREGGYRVFETVHQDREGNVYPVEVRIQILGEGMDRVLYVSAFDLTEKKRAEQKADAERAELERLVEERTASIRLQSRILDQTNDAVVTTDLTGIINGWYGGAAEFFGLSAERAIGRSLKDLFPDREGYGFHTRFILPVVRCGRLETEATLKHDSGRLLHAQIQLSLLKDDEGEPSGLIMTSVDISEIRQREQQLEQLARKLELVNQELESFSYSVSHDLRAPLRAIDGFSQALLEDYGERLDEEGQDYLRRVRGGAQRMAELIDDLLNLSRVNRSEMKPETIDLTRIAEEVVRELRQGDRSRDVEVLIEPGLKAYADPRLIRVLLQNLIGNSWKFTSKTENPRIELRSSEDSPSSFCVEDNGVGFDMRHAGKLFGAFQRLHRASEYPGTGIGLATVKRIIARHGGEIQAEAEPGRGARFCFTLPDPPAEEVQEEGPE